MLRALLFASLSGLAFGAAAQQPAAKPAPAAAPAGAAQAIPLAAPVEHPHVTMRTNMGDITIELYPEKAPKTVENFLQYTKDKYYNGTTFHRVIDGFMIQGGGYTQDLKPRPTRAPIPNEANNGLSNLTGTVAMARTGDPNSATAQFFINVNDNKFLDAPQRDGGAYAVFGKVVAGTEVVDAIRGVKTTTKSAPNGQPFQDVPAETVTINSITRVSAEDAKKYGGK